MKTFPFRALRLMRRDAVQALRHLRRWFAVHGMSVALAMLLVLGGLAFMRSCDDAVIRSTAALNAESKSYKAVARQVSYFGDFLGFNVSLLVVLQGAGWLLRSRRLLRVAMASLLCACFAGATANVLRPLLGRPRPSTHLADQFYGPSFKGDLHALPSAHAATSFGAALPVLMTVPTFGAPLTLGAAAVGWSRIQLDRHHLTDVLASASIALMFSLPLSHWALQRRLQVRGATSTRQTLPHVLAPSHQPQ